MSTKEGPVFTFSFPGGGGLPPCQLQRRRSYSAKWSVVQILLQTWMKRTLRLIISKKSQFFVFMS